MKNKIRSFFAFFFLVVLGACGGGSSPPPAQPPIGNPPPEVDANTPLAINDQNAPNVAIVTTALTEAMLQTGDVSNRAVKAVASVGTTQFSVPCSNGGAIDFTWSDNDQDGTVSTGDTIVAIFSDCFQPALNDVLAGTINITIQNPPALAEGESGYSFDAQMSGATTGNASSGGASLTGTLTVTSVFDNEGIAENLAVTSVNDFELAITAPGTQTFTETISNFDASKSVSLRTARYILDASGQFSSELLNGRVVLSVPASESVSGYLNTYPNAGRFEVAGAGGTTLIMVPDPDFPDTARITGVGITTMFNIEWSAMIENYLWWDARVADDYSTVDFFGSFDVLSITPETSPQGEPLSITPEFLIQLTRPLQSLSSTMIFEATDGSGAPTRTADGLFDGARLLISTDLPLEQNTEYVLRLNGESTMISESGLTTEFPNIAFRTGQAIKAHANTSAVYGQGGDQASLFLRLSQNEGDPEVNYVWRQVSGPFTPIFGDGATVLITMPVVSVPTDLVFEGEATQVTGPSDTDTVTIRVYPDTSNLDMLYMDDYNEADIYGRPRFLSSEDGTFTAVRQGDNSIAVSVAIGTPPEEELWEVRFRAPAGAEITTGVYPDVVEFGDEQAAFQPQAYFGVVSSVCSPLLGGNFDVQEIAYAPDGTLTRLAVEFTLFCGDLSLETTGSVRFNSDLPAPTQRP